jgi:hypothetical protein
VADDHMAAEGYTFVTPGGPEQCDGHIEPFSPPPHEPLSSGQVCLRTEPVLVLVLSAIGFLAVEHEKNANKFVAEGIVDVLAPLLSPKKTTVRGDRIP